jgi:hypothetical protein
MTVTTAKTLTVETVPSYIREHWDGDDGIGKSVMSTAAAAAAATTSLDGIEVSAIQGGNVNYAFQIKLPAVNKTVFLKQVWNPAVTLSFVFVVVAG